MGFQFHLFCDTPQGHLRYFSLHQPGFSSLKSGEKKMHLRSNFINYTGEYWLMLKVTIITMRRNIHVRWKQKSLFYCQP